MIGDIVTFFKYRRDCLLGDEEIAYLRALSAFLKEIYRRKSGHEKCTFDVYRGRGVKEIYLLADLLERTQISIF